MKIDEMPQGENYVEETPGPGTQVFGIDREGTIGVDSKFILVV